MARATAPLLSMTAHGDIAGLMQYTRSKGQNVVRAKPVSNPGSSPELLASQAHHRNAVAFYRTLLANVEVRDAWKRHATYKRYRMSAYDTAMKSMLESFAVSADPAHTWAIRGYWIEGVEFRTKGVTTHDDPDEAGDFVCMAGDNPGRLLNHGSAEMYEAQAVQFELLPHTWPIWVQLFKAGVPRSGIIQLEEAVPGWSGLHATGTDIPPAMTNVYPLGQFNGYTVYAGNPESYQIWSDGKFPTPSYVMTSVRSWWPDAYWVPDNPETPIGPWRYQGAGEIKFTYAAI